ncbi:NAD-dependent epimerase/dehydratase family protein [Opitutus sp. ER46]|uniref:NAD-dependent epimerase/dehydratase family protein n=1 Tax=Opitutus sp. ER46 TaxID=2161864 RepID=UPI000D30549E|nr:NAD-dependent epimerase/dehydratase family protein [Opitutus sp. ER46]PTX91115.1 epimerase [Opitutus sp. ER46]
MAESAQASHLPLSAETISSLRGRSLFVTGCGYVGSVVAIEALRLGLEVVALTRNAATASTLGAAGVKPIVADLASDSWHRELRSAPDFVLNCVSSGGGGVDGYRRSYLNGMQSLLRWARAVGGVETIVYTSSTSVYSDGGGRRVEETALDPIAVARHPAVVGTAANSAMEARLFAVDRREILRATERELVQAGDACGRWFVLRLAGIYGPSRHGLLDQVRSGEASGSGETHLNLAHRDDIASAILECFGAPVDVRNQAFNVADDQPTRKAEVVTWLAAQLGCPMPRFSGTAAAGRTRLTPDRLISNAKLKAILGWRPRFPSYREGYQAILRDGGATSAVS